MKLPLNHYKVEALIHSNDADAYRLLCAANPDAKVDPEQVELSPRADRLPLIRLLISPLGEG